MISGTNTMFHLNQGQGKRARIIAVDSRYHDTAGHRGPGNGSPSVPGPIPPSLIAMANVLIKEGLQDQAFLDNTRSALIHSRPMSWAEDGQDKTPAWAAEISGVSASTIERLAREYGTTRPPP